MEIDDRFIDVRFDHEPEFVGGCKAETDFGRFASFEDSIEVLDWQAIDEAIDRMDEFDNGLEWLVSRIYDQSREGACVANACGQAQEVLEASQVGYSNVVPKSAISLYKRIGDSASSGAMVSDGLKELCSRGILPLDTPTNRAQFGNAVMPNTGFSTPFPSGWEDTAIKFAGHEYEAVRTTQGLFTALVCRLPVVVGREGHSICYVRPRRDGGQRTVDYANSWSLKWGFAAGNMSGGFGRDTARQVEKSAQYCFVLRSVRTPILL